MHEQAPTSTVPVSSDGRSGSREPSLAAAGKLHDDIVAAN